MSKKTPAAAAAETEPAQVQTSAPATEAPATEAPADPPEQDIVAAEQPPEPVRGRALVDLPGHGLKCGEFGTLPAAVAQSLAEAGGFDPKAVEA